MTIVFVFSLIEACLFDLCYRKIPNSLSLTIMIIGLVGHSIVNNSLGLSNSLYGLMTGFICSFLLYFFSNLGAGDVKFISAIGAVVGSQSILVIVAYSYIFSGIFIILYLILWYQKKKLNSAALKPKAFLSYHMPMAPGISFATAYVLYNHHF